MIVSVLELLSPFLEKHGHFGRICTRLRFWKTIESIQSYANHHSISLTKKEYDKRFQELLEKLPDKAVILIDEYDEPILNYITDPVKAEKVKEILKGFYTAIKGSDAHVRFAFLTGVTKFAKISVFSGLNNLTDLTMKKDYA